MAEANYSPIIFSQAKHLITLGRGNDQKRERERESYQVGSLSNILSILSVCEIIRREKGREREKAGQHIESISHSTAQED
jgi:hypothetical protein